jgi:Zn-dependent protease/CBS domain-containing protein
MRATLRLGRIGGIPVAAHWSVLIIGGLLAFGLTGGSSDSVLWLVVIAMVVVFLGSLLAHELAHSIVARREGVPVTGITLWLLGGVARLGGRIPAMSYALAAGFFALGRFAHMVGVDPLLEQALDWLAFVNVVLGTFNLIPAAPLDGGRILAGAVWAVSGNRTRAELVAARAGQGFGLLLVAGGVVGPMLGIPFFSLWTVVMGLFLFQTAGAERRQVLLVDDLGSRRIDEVMTPGPETVRGWMTVAAFLQECEQLPPRHHILPVVGWDGDIIGVVTLERLARVPAADRARFRVQDVAYPTSTVLTARPDERVIDVVSRVGAGALPVVLVLDGPVLTGIITGADLTRDAARVHAAASA